MLVNNVIIDLTCLYMIQLALFTIVHATIILVNEKAQSYTMCTSRNDFIPLTIKIYGYLHFCFEFFFLLMFRPLQFIIKSPRFFNFHNVYVLLLVACAHKLLTCADHYNFSTCFHIWGKYFSSLPYITINAFLSLTNLW